MAEVDLRLQTPQVVDVAADLAHYILQGDSERLEHSRAVAGRAKFLTLAVADDQAPLLVAAAWLHDIGYAPGLQQTGFHPLDGANHVRAAGWPAIVCGLVAHHSGSRFVANERGLDDALAHFEFHEDLLSDALTTADQTMGPHGRPMTVGERIDDMLARHGDDSPNARAHSKRGPYLVQAARRVARRLETAGVGRNAHRIF
jgi:predicted HD phosphohydrolase